jgi:hypothetical protein
VSAAMIFLGPAGTGGAGGRRPGGRARRGAGGFPGAGFKVVAYETLRGQGACDATDRANPKAFRLLHHGRRFRAVLMPRTPFYVIHRLDAAAAPSHFGLANLISARLAVR